MHMSMSRPVPAGVRCFGANGREEYMLVLDTLSEEQMAHYGVVRVFFVLGVFQKGEYELIQYSVFYFYTGQWHFFFCVKEVFCFFLYVV